MRMDQRRNEEVNRKPFGCELMIGSILLFLIYLLFSFIPDKYLNYLGKLFFKIRYLK